MGWVWGTTRRVALAIGGASIVIALGTGEAAAESLSNAMAQQAVLDWLAGNGSATVEDVQEIPAANAAKADVTVTDMRWNSPRNDAVTAYAFGPGGGVQVYSGHLDAFFAHYTDGSWALVRVVGPMGSYDNLHFVVR
jgi:hypothetical protein